MASDVVLLAFCSTQVVDWFRRGTLYCSHICCWVKKGRVFFRTVMTFGLTFWNLCNVELT